MDATTTPKPCDDAGKIAGIVLAVVFGVLLVIAIVWILYSNKEREEGKANAAKNALFTTAASLAASATGALTSSAPSAYSLSTYAPSATSASSDAPAPASYSTPTYMPSAAYAPSGAYATSGAYAPAGAYAPSGAYATSASYAPSGYMPGSVPPITEGVASTAAQDLALQKASNAKRTSDKMADDVARGVTASSTSTAASNEPRPMAPSANGKLGSAIATADGKSLVHMANSKIGNTGSMDDFVDASADGLQLYAPDLKETMDKSLSLSGVSASFGLDPTETQMRKQQAIADNMLLAGTVDPSVDQVLDASAPFIATSSAIRRAIAAQSSVNNETIIQTPLRFMWQSPLYRPAIPMATMSPITSDLMTPGQAFYLQSIACANGDGPVVQESF